MSAEEAERSFLSFARAAMETRTAHEYAERTPVARQAAVYTFLKERLYAPPGLEFPELSPIWHLLSWVVVALEAHLAATAIESPTSGPTCTSAGQPSELSEGEIRAVGECVWGRTWGVWESEGFSDEFSRDKWDRVVAVIRALDEYRVGQKGKRG